MRLSRLQKYILNQSYLSKNSGQGKTELYNYYSKKEIKENKIGVMVGIQSSVDNLVAKDLAVAYGYRTAKKWHISRVKLTAKGRRLAKELIKKRQRKLPIK